MANQVSLFEQGLAAGRTVDVEITGPDINQLVALGGRMFGQIGTLLDETQARRDGIWKEGQPSPRPPQGFPQPSLATSNPEVWIVPKPDQAPALQLTSADLGYAVDALVDGAYATDYFSGGDKIDLRIVGEERYAKSSQSLASLPIATPTGQLVPLEAVAN